MWILLALACTSASDPSPQPEATGCNGHDHLCDRPLDAVSMVKTHNSNASEERGYLLASRNHTEALPTQLADGVRALNFDVYDPFDAGVSDVEGEPLLVCHGYCTFGSQPFQEILAGLHTFLSDNPREVVLLDFQNETTVDRLVTELQQSGLPDIAIEWDGGPWPTLAQLIQADTRLLLFLPGGGPPAWLHDRDSLMVRTDWGAASPDDWSCATNRPLFDHALFELDQTLTDPITSPELATTANTNPLLSDRIAECTAAVGKAPNTISVDYYSTGDVFAEVHALNAP